MLETCPLIGVILWVDYYTQFKNILSKYMGSGDFLHCTSNIIVNSDLSATVTLELCNVCYKSMQSVTPDPEDWIQNAIHNRARIEGDVIYKKELERHLDNGTMPSNPTKAQLILDYEKPVIITPPQETPLVPSP